MGLQRHLKVAGIFARLTLRHGKPLPRVGPAAALHRPGGEPAGAHRLRLRADVSMPRFHCPSALHSGATLSLPAATARHVQVLRLQPGGVITLFNGEGGEFEATVTRMGRSDVEVEVGAHHAIERELARAVHLVVAMPANDRMDWLVEKATELGAASL